MSEHPLTPEQAKSLLDFYADNPRRWAQGEYALVVSDDDTDRRLEVSPDDPKANCWCAAGALTVINGCGSPLDLLDNHDNIVEWNDSCASFEELLADLRSVVAGTYEDSDEDSDEDDA